LLNVEGLGRQLYPDLDLWTTALPFLEEWNRRRMHPQTLYRALKENVPDWIEQLPYLPQLAIDTLAQSRQLSEIRAALELDVAAEQLRRTRRRSRALKGGLLLLAAAAATLIPGLDDMAAQLPLAGVLLSVAAVYLLCFRE